MQAQLIVIGAWFLMAIPNTCPLDIYIMEPPYGRPELCEVERKNMQALMPMYTFTCGQLGES